MSDNEKIIAKLQDAAAYFRSGFDAMYGTVACEKYRNWTDAIEQAIALLKAQEQEPNEDWISRKRLKDEIQYYIDEAGWGEEANIVLGWCLEFIDNQQAVKWE